MFFAGCRSVRLRLLAVTVAVLVGSAMGLTWQNTGELSGAQRVSDLTTGPNGYLYAAADNAGITADSGRVFYSSDFTNWQLSGDLPGDVYRLTSLLRMANGELLAAGRANNGTFGGWVYHSADGQNWTGRAMVSGTGMGNMVTGLVQNQGGRLLTCNNYMGMGTAYPYFSTDLGSSWVRSTTIAYNADHQFLFVAADNATYLGGGFNGQLRKTTDQGVSWVQAASGMSHFYKSAMAQNAGGTMFLGTRQGGAGYVYRTTDNGGTWSLVYDASPSQIRSLCCASDGYVYAGALTTGSDADVFCSTDNGTTWTSSGTLTGADTVFRLLDVNVSGTHYLYAATGPNGDVFRAALGPSNTPDVKTVSVDAPTGAIDHGVAVTPSATLKNDGTMSATFDAKFDVRNGGTSLYTFTRTGITLAAGAQLQFDFGSWTPATVGGPFSVVCSTRLAGDPQENNNKATGTVSVLPYAPTLALPADGDTTKSQLPEFSWLVVTGSEYYRVQVDDDPLFGSPVEGTSTGLTWTPTAPLSEDTWHWRVCGSIAAGDGPWSVERTLVIDLTPPALPVLILPLQDTTRENLPLFDWQSIADARQFNMALFDNAHAPVPGFPVNIVQGPGEDTSSLQLASALADGKYTWAVEALDYAANSSGYCPENWFAVDRTPPAIPVLVDPTGGETIGTALPNLDWDPVADARRFDVRLYDAAHQLIGSWTVLQPEGENNSSYELVAGEELDEGGYSWQARATDYAGNASDYSEEESFIVELAPNWPAGWHEVANVPSLPSPLAVKDGGWLATAVPGTDAKPFIYAAKGNKTSDFFRYDPLDSTVGKWHALDSIPSSEAGRVKRPKKGCVGVSDGERYIYMTKGNNTLGFWRYDIAGDSWSRLPDVPAGPDGKKVKGGDDLAYVPGDTGHVYLLKGYRTEFYRYNVRAGRWDTLDNVLYGVAPKYNAGSFLVYDDNNTLYAHQAKYTDPLKTRHFMFKYDLASQAWQTEAGAKGMPVSGMDGGKIKNKKSKDGGAGAWFGGRLYALKGGNTGQFYHYEPAPGDSWAELDTMPSYGSTAKKKKVKAGGDLVSYGYGAFFALKGNKTVEFWRYVIPTPQASRFTPQARSGVMAERVANGEWRMAITPNPLTSGFATLRLVGATSRSRLGNRGLETPPTVRVFDAAGRCVLMHSVSPSLHHTASIDLRKLPNGVYLVRLDAEGHSQSQKLVVQK